MTYACTIVAMKGTALLLIARKAMRYLSDRNKECARSYCKFAIQS